MKCTVYKEYRKSSFCLEKDFTVCDYLCFFSLVTWHSYFDISRSFTFVFFTNRKFVEKNWFQIDEIYSKGQNICFQIEKEKKMSCASCSLVSHKG